MTTQFSLLNQVSQSSADSLHNIALRYLSEVNVELTTHRHDDFDGVPWRSIGVLQEFKDETSYFAVAG